MLRQHQLHPRAVIKWRHLANDIVTFRECRPAGSSREFLKEIFELHKREVWGTSGIQGRSPGRGSGGKHIVVYCNKFELAGIFISKLKIYTVFRDILSICQLHMLSTRTAQISLELHFCVELHI